MGLRAASTPANFSWKLETDTTRPHDCWPETLQDSKIGAATLQPSPGLSDTRAGTPVFVF